jgi:glucokinase
MAVFGPGTGLGVACFLPAAAGGPAAIATEGGHADIAATTEREAAVIAVLRRRFGHVSAERLLSGPGLTNIHAALCAIDGREPSAPLRPGDIARAAQARGRARDARARETVAMFSALLGQLAGDLALGFGARGGVYVAGGVVARLGPAFDRKLFRRRFEDKGRYRDWLKPVPVWLITHPHPAMLGLARYLARSARTRA